MKIKSLGFCRVLAASQVCPEFKWLSFGEKHADMCTHRKTTNTWSQLSRLKEPWLTHLRKRTKKPLTESRILSSTKQSRCSQSSQSRPSELDCNIMIMLSFEWVLFPSMELLINKLILWRSLCPHVDSRERRAHKEGILSMCLHELLFMSMS